MKKTKKLTLRDLAKDVLRLLDAKKIKAREGLYMGLHDKMYDNWDVVKDRSMQRALRAADWKPCEVCAIGALFVAEVDKRNALTLERANGMDSLDMASKLADIVGEPALRKIEAAFEGSNPCCSRHATDQTVEFYRRYKTDRGRLRAIMQNIIEHGEFRP